MAKSVILEEFESGIHCVKCNAVTVHKMQTIDKKVEVNLLATTVNVMFVGMFRISMKKIF